MNGYDTSKPDPSHLIDLILHRRKITGRTIMRGSLQIAQGFSRGNQSRYVIGRTSCIFETLKQLLDKGKVHCRLRSFSKIWSVLVELFAEPKTASGN